MKGKVSQYVRLPKSAKHDVRCGEMLRVLYTARILLIRPNQPTHTNPPIPAEHSATSPEDTLADPLRRLKNGDPWMLDFHQVAAAGGSPSHACGGYLGTTAVIEGQSRCGILFRHGWTGYLHRGGRGSGDRQTGPYGGPSTCSCRYSATRAIQKGTCDRA